MNRSGVGRTPCQASAAYMRGFIHVFFGYAQHIRANKKFGRVCRVYVAWSRRRSLTALEITWENLATYAT